MENSHDVKPKSRKSKLIHILSNLHESIKEGQVYSNLGPDTKMKYPAIRVNVDARSTEYANGVGYITQTRYILTVISKEETPAVLGPLMRLPTCAPQRVYRADDLYHNTFTIYY